MTTTYVIQHAAQGTVVAQFDVDDAFTDGAKLTFAEEFKAGVIFVGTIPNDALCPSCPRTIVPVTPTPIAGYAIEQYTP